MCLLRDARTKSGRVVGALQQFRPSKVLVEHPHDDPSLLVAYRDFATALNSEFGPKRISLGSALKLFEASAIETVLRTYDLIWVREGDVHTLRYTFARSKADDALVALLNDDALVYGGYSAGVCVLAPTLRGLEMVDDPPSVRHLYGADPIWEGLGILDYCMVPHADSPDHPESEVATGARVTTDARESPSGRCAMVRSSSSMVNGQLS